VDERARRPRGGRVPAEARSLTPCSCRLFLVHSLLGWRAIGWSVRLCQSRVGSGGERYAWSSCVNLRLSRNKFDVHSYKTLLTDIRAHTRLICEIFMYYLLFLTQCNDIVNNLTRKKWLHFESHVLRNRNFNM
jgi:hypothetical protein